MAQNVGHANSPLSDQECRDYAQSVTKAVASGDLAALNALIDWNQIFDTVVCHGMEMTTKRREDLILGLRSGIEQRRIVYEPTDQERPRPEGRLDFLRTRQNHGRQVILFRMIQPDEHGRSRLF